MGFFSGVRRAAALPKRLIGSKHAAPARSVGGNAQIAAASTGKPLRGFARLGR